MLTFKIHFTLPDGTEDYVAIQGEDMDDLREKARDTVESRRGTDPWSEQID
jgi:hypothetical protein